MVKILLHGCNGAMGQVIAGLAQKDSQVVIAAGVDLNTEQKQDFPVYASLEEVKEDVDVVVDFASAKAVDGLLDYCGKHRIPVVLCTTGLSEEQIGKVKETSVMTAVLRSANMSLGVNLLFKLVAEAAKTLSAAGFDMEIVESTTIRKWTPPAELLLLWRMRPTKLWETPAITYMTEASAGRRGIPWKLESALSAAAPL